MKDDDGDENYDTIYETEADEAEEIGYASMARFRQYKASYRPIIGPMLNGDAR